jgi:hypothetical protein
MFEVPLRARSYRNSIRKAPGEHANLQPRAIELGKVRGGSPISGAQQDLVKGRRSVL